MNDVIPARRIEATLAESPTAPLETIAERAGVTVADVVRRLPAGEAVCVDGEHFVEVMKELTHWGEITFIVNTGDVILEARGEVPEGSVGRGFYNLNGKPIGGHLKADACGMIAFVSRQLFGSPTRSIQFYGHAGHCLFKVYLGRDEERQIKADQVEKFVALREQLAC
ncbi:heme utilization cystosolic carrier protein HutX [Thioalkalivibrio sp. XN8]|uniref:heme utilization cystosolic carrier protein HutX n=1 Tax=Thioalkalivibrio sp. XN8 TaxID=2712863 RepID=UPI0013EA43E9|nr:heme utilization cystosolic carrier protein HutX [Thioalkalivibrio sp. XN8]NGP54523.1 heme utilization cystosolic carrier protein HutX [Thioalkalivibrio sp. XN8]